MFFLKKNKSIIKIRVFYWMSKRAGNSKRELSFEFDCEKIIRAGFHSSHNQRATLFRNECKQTWFSQTQRHISSTMGSIFFCNRHFSTLSFHEKLIKPNWYNIRTRSQVVGENSFEKCSNNLQKKTLIKSPQKNILKIKSNQS